MKALREEEEPKKKKKKKKKNASRFLSLFDVFLRALRVNHDNDNDEENNDRDHHRFHWPRC